MMQVSPHIIFHAGLRKTATTFLQKKVFPYLSGIQYIPPEQYHRHQAIIRRSKSNVILLSREFDRELETELSSFGRNYPHAQIIICLRSPAQWVASQYKKHVKNGFSGNFDEFVDVENDTGYWSLNELDFARTLKKVSDYFIVPPRLLFYEDFCECPEHFFASIENMTSAQLTNSVATEQRVHPSYSDHQLIWLRSITRITGLPFVRDYPQRWHRILIYRPFWLLYHLILYLSVLLPQRKTELIEKHVLKEIEKRFHPSYASLREKYGSKKKLKKA